MLLGTEIEVFMKTLVHAAVLALLLTGTVAAQTATGDDAAFEPVHPAQLTKLLPDGSRDFRAGKADGRMSAEVGSKITIASRVYTSKTADELEEDAPRPTVTIKITDSPATKAFSQVYEALAGMGQSATSGFSNALSLDGYSAIQNYRESGQVGMLTVYVADRFLVQVAIKGLPKETMMEWWEKIDAKKLAALAIPPTPTPVPTPSHTPASSPTNEG